MFTRGRFCHPVSEVTAPKTPAEVERCCSLLLHLRDVRCAPVQPHTSGECHPANDHGGIGYQSFSAVSTYVRAGIDRYSQFIQLT